MARHVKCTKCGRLLVAFGSETPAKRRKRSDGNYAVRFEFSAKGVVGRIVCRCGHETPFSAFEAKRKGSG